MNLLDHISDSVAVSIARSNSWADGDTWPLDKGLVAEYDGRENAFNIKNAKTGEHLGFVSFALVYDKGVYAQRRL